MANRRVRCFFLEPTDSVRLALRVARHDSKCPAHPQGWRCQTYVPIGEAKALRKEGEEEWILAPHVVAQDDPRWPTACHGCKAPFTKDDWRDVDQERVFRRKDNGALLTLDEAQPGAMWFAPWYGDHKQFQGRDGRCLVVRLPDGHDWIVDSVCANCNEQNMSHKCWERSGEPPDVDVTKGGTAKHAGGGSVDTGKWHGHLRKGWLA